MLELQIAGVRFQLWIALALIARWLGLFAYRCCSLSARQKWRSIVIAEVGLILAMAIFAWYGLLSYRVLHLETVCSGCMTQASGLLGSTAMWTSLLALVMLVQTVYGFARLILPLIDALRASGTPTET
jgi:hypothetical protein